MLKNVIDAIYILDSLVDFLSSIKCIDCFDSLLLLEMIKAAWTLCLADKVVVANIDTSICVIWQC